MIESIVIRPRDWTPKEIERIIGIVSKEEKVEDKEVISYVESFAGFIAKLVKIPEVKGLTLSESEQPPGPNCLDLTVIVPLQEDGRSADILHQINTAEAELSDKIPPPHFFSLYYMTSSEAISKIQKRWCSQIQSVGFFGDTSTHLAFITFDRSK